MYLVHFLSAHIVDIVQTLTLAALVWYAWETRKSRLEDRGFHRGERRIDYYFRIKRQEEPSKTDLLRFAGHPTPHQTDALATVANLGKLALLLEAIVFQSRSAQAREYPLSPVVLPSGESVQFIVADLIVRYLHEIGSISGSMPAERQAWTGELEISLRFYSRGIARVSETQRYAVGIGFDAVQTIHFIQDDNEADSPRLTKSVLANS